MVPSRRTKEPEQSTDAAHRNGGMAYKSGKITTTMRTSVWRAPGNSSIALVVSQGSWLVAKVKGLNFLLLVIHVMPQGLCPAASLTPSSLQGLTAEEQQVNRRRMSKVEVTANCILTARMMIDPTRLREEAACKPATAEQGAKQWQGLPTRRGRAI